MLPTVDCIDEVFDRLIDHALARQLSWWQRVLAAPFVAAMQGSAVQMARAALADMAYDVPLLRLGRSSEDTQSIKRACLARRGLAKAQIEASLQEKLEGFGDAVEQARAPREPGKR